MNRKGFKPAALVLTAVLVGISLASLILFGSVRSSLAQEGVTWEEGNACVQDFQSGAVCTANDVRFEELRPVQTLVDCASTGGVTTTVVFEALIGALGSPNRYDIGIFLALDGTTHDVPGGQTELGALGGDACFHSFLSGSQTASPLFELDRLPLPSGDGISETVVEGPWWNGGNDADSCGDMPTNSGVQTVLKPITVACVDNDHNGYADVSVCTSWDNNTNSVCSGLPDAFPGTNSKCSCTTINFDFAPTAITLVDAEATPKLQVTGPLLMVVALLMAMTILVWRHRVRRRPLPGEID